MPGSPDRGRAPDGGRAPNGGNPVDLPPSAPKSGRGVPDEIGDVRRRIEQQTPYSPDERTLLSLASEYLSKGQQIRDKKQRFVAQRFVASAEALSRAIELGQRLPEARTAPSKEDANRRVEDVYLRLKQADYFVAEIDAPDVRSLADVARRLYQRALQAVGNDNSTAKNLSDAADEVVAALESLAQAKASARGSKK